GLVATELSRKLVALGEYELAYNALLCYGEARAYSEIQHLSFTLYSRVSGIDGMYLLNDDLGILLTGLPLLIEAMAYVPEDNPSSYYNGIIDAIEYKISKHSDGLLTAQKLICFNGRTYYIDDVFGVSCLASDLVAAGYSWSASLLYTSNDIDEIQLSIDEKINSEWGNSTEEEILFTIASPLIDDEVMVPGLYYGDDKVAINSYNEYIDNLLYVLEHAPLKAKYNLINLDESMLAYQNYYLVNSDISLAMPEESLLQ
ncbi:hypothetical protein LJC04_06090, partial [Ruminococcaceae bacterium OttesenSCG-928-O06]|nr:hypothetical protein [Ruminococcaceae bacterium OttesenSCG-928-O06]